MANIMEPILESVDLLLIWLGMFLKQAPEDYCELQTADSPTVLVGNDGSLMSVVKVSGVKALVGNEEFKYMQRRLVQAFRSSMSRSGHTVQAYFSYNKDEIAEDITNILKPANETARRLGLELSDLFSERVTHLSYYCAHEEVFLALWTRPQALTSEQSKQAARDKMKMIKKQKIPPFRFTQNLIAAIPDLRDLHDSFVRSVSNDLSSIGVVVESLEVHEALCNIKRSIDAEFTSHAWRPLLPGDMMHGIQEAKKMSGDISDIVWPALSRQLFTRDGENIDLRTVRIGDRVYSCVFIDLFPKEVQSFNELFMRALPLNMPWRMSFLVDSNGLASLKIKSAMTSIMSWTSAQNRLINDATNLLKYIDLNTDDAVVRMRVVAVTWAPADNIRLLRTRASQLAKAIEGWGSCNVSEVSGDAFAGAASSMLGISTNSVAVPTVAPLSSVMHMLPFFRPSSPWQQGAILFRSPDGKPWPYQPGSSEQTTWIDLVYARPGSGKSVLSNAMNLALCLSSGIQRLPRIAIIDIGPSSSGLISLLKEALPYEKRHLAAYHRLRMDTSYSINPFDTQLGARFPTPQERGFLVNFITMLATPIGAPKPYDGIPDMVGMVVDEMYKNNADDGNPEIYTPGVEELIDALLEEIGFFKDSRTTWWEVVDALFLAGFAHESMLAQRHAVPLLSDATSICRHPAIGDLYGKITAPTSETLIEVFIRMISSAVREYPILSQATKFDIGEARVVSLDLDEVAKTGGDAANRQTAVMYMLARYVLAHNFYFNEDDVPSMREIYRPYHQNRAAEIKEDPKRLVFDEFHRTAKTPMVREQAVVDMREGRKWKVQVALISQSLEDFDSVMVEFATSIFIMDAGPEQAIRKTASVFGLTETAQNALRSYVHGPRASGSTFLAQFATKEGMNTQLLTATLGPVELWAFTTTAEDCNLRNQLYRKIGPAEARRVLATLFPGGSSIRYLEKRLANLKDQGSIIDEDVKAGVLDQLVIDIMKEYARNPNFKNLP